MQTKLKNRFPHIFPCYYKQCTKELPMDIYYLLVIIYLYFLRITYYSWNYWFIGDELSEAFPYFFQSGYAWLYPTHSAWTCVKEGMGFHIRVGKTVFFLQAYISSSMNCMIYILWFCIFSIGIFAFYFWFTKSLCVVINTSFIWHIWRNSHFVICFWNVCVYSQFHYWWVLHFQICLLTKISL